MTIEEICKIAEIDAKRDLETKSAYSINPLDDWEEEDEGDEEWL